MRFSVPLERLFKAAHIELMEPRTDPQLARLSSGELNSQGIFAQQRGSFLMSQSFIGGGEMDFMKIMGTCFGGY